MSPHLPKKFMCFAISILLLIGVAVGSLFLWVAQAPREIRELTPYLEQALSSIDGRYSAQIGETWLVWGSWQRPIDIRLRDIRIITKEQKTFSTFKEVSVSLDLLQLPLGRILPTSITLNKPALRLYQDENRAISFGFGGEEAANTEEPQQIVENTEESVPFSAFVGMLFSTDSQSGLRKLRRFVIHDATVGIGDKKRRIFFKMTHTEIVARRDLYGNIKMVAGGEMKYMDMVAPIGIEVIAEMGKSTIGGTLMFENIAPSKLSSLFVEEQPVLKTIDAPLSGKISILLNKDATLNHLGFNIDGGKGVLNHEKLRQPLNFESLHAEGRLGDKLHHFEVQYFKLVTEGSNISGNGSVTIKDDDMAVIAQVIGTNIDARKVKLFWPPSLSPLSREWITENITEGTVPEAEARVNIQYGDLKKPLLPKEAVDASINLTGATIRYLPEHPPVKKLDAVLRVDAVSLAADITSASFMDATKLNSGKLSIDDLNADNPYIKIMFSGETNAKDAVRFLELPRLQHAKHLNLDPVTAKGAADINADLGFYFFSTGNDAEDIRYAVTAQMKDFTVPAFLKKFDIQSGSGTISVDNKRLIFSGTGKVNGASALQADVIYKFEPEEGVDTLIDVTAIAPVESLPKFGYPAFAPSKGPLGVKANVRIGPEIEEASATIDLTKANLNIQEVGWKKPEGEVATLEIQSEKKNGVTIIPAFSIIGPNTEAIGSAKLSKGASVIDEIRMQKTRIGAMNLDTLEYIPTDEGTKLTAIGASADISKWLAKEDGKPSEFSFKNFPAIDLKTDIMNVRLSEHGNIKNLKGDLNCDKRLCKSANLTGIVGDNKKFEFRILKNPNGKRQMSLRADEAGAFLKAVGIFPNIEGGDLSLSGNFDESAAGSILRGKLVLSDYTVKKAPVLAKILALTSITGVADLLQGNGISFSRLTVPFVLRNDVVAIEKGKAYGPSIGITVEGTLTFPAQLFDMQGTVVPAYVINNFLSKVPLVGTLLTGGDGKGVFAFSYSVKGSENDPQVSVNPLSILTPGFLRGIFEKQDIVPKEDN